MDRLSKLAQAIFSDMFDAFTTPDSKYPVATLRDVAELINGDRSGNYPSGDDLVDSGVLFLSTRNLNGDTLSLSNCNFITEAKFASLSRGKLKRHDLVITLRGTLGECVEFDCEYETGFINAQMMIIRPSERICATVLRAFIAHPRTAARLMQDRSGSAVPQLTAKQIGDLIVPVPPIGIQNQFSMRLKAVRQTVDAYTAHLRKLDDIFNALQHRAFRGEL
jgi:type I restriction enzyme, S subunit